MRPTALAVVALVAAALGAAAVLVLESATGVVGETRVETIVVERARERPAATTAVARAPSARLLPSARFDPVRIYSARSPGVVTIFAYFDEQLAQGSGFVVSPSGHILTNSHVITDAGENGADADVRAADRLYVEFQDGDRIPAKIVGWDIFDDVGLVKVDPRDHRLHPVPLGNSDNVVVGSPTAAIGSPFGNVNSLSVGVVSATHRSIASLTSRYSVADAIQTDAAINHGNSGGPLLDARGRVIGINAQIRSGTGTGEGVGFAIPINWAKHSMAQLLAKGEVEYAYLGVRAGDVTPSLARHLGYGRRRAAIIDCVEEDSVAAKAGLRGGGKEKEFNGMSYRADGDLLVAINGIPIRGADDVVRVVSQRLRPREVATFTVLRDGKEKTLAVRLGTRPKRPKDSSCD
ncbi:MAG: trypsin-like peptidase domain-containing protein [Actinomycetota bacterium]|nr:trypsin-like peptidase domain-containing protein [Actinomycetota bacterium]